MMDMSVKTFWRSARRRSCIVALTVWFFFLPTYGQQVVATIPVVSVPVGLAVTPDGSLLYVCNFGDRVVSVIDLATRQVVDAIPTAPGAIWIAFRPQSTEAYVANAFSNEVSVIDTATRTVIERIAVSRGPHNLAFTPDGAQAYVAIFPKDDQEGGGGKGAVDVIDAETRTRVASIAVGSFPHHVTFHPDGSRAYVASFGDSAVFVVDTADYTVLNRIPTADVPAGLAITPDGTTLFVSHYIQDRGVASIIDLTIEQVVMTLEVPPGGHTLTLTPDATQVHIANDATDKISVIDVTTRQVVQIYTVGLGPYGIAFHPGGQEAYTTNAYEDTVSVVRLAKSVTDSSK